MKLFVERNLPCLMPFWREAWSGKMEPCGHQESNGRGPGRPGAVRREKSETAVMDGVFFTLDSLGNSSHFRSSLMGLSITISDSHMIQDHQLDSSMRSVHAH